MEILKRDDFYAQERRICIQETEQEDSPMGQNFVKKVKACPFRQKCAVAFSEKYFKEIEFAECTHPSKSKPNFLADYCPPMISRIDEEPAE